MLPLQWHLQKSGFETERFGYRSLFGSIEIHAARFRQFLNEINRAPQHCEIHIVAHSLGCIVTRAALLDTQPDKLKRVVMLAPPNQGSPVAGFLSRRVVPWCRTLSQLSDRENSFVRQLPEPAGLEIGVVAASHDRVIPAANNGLKCLADQVFVFSGHNGLLVRPASFTQVVDFLRSGQFTQPKI